MKETQYDRHLNPVPKSTTKGLRGRFEDVVGITGMKLAKYRQSWASCILTPFDVVWRPHVILILIYEALLFGFGIGINVTNAVFLGTPKEEGGFGFSQFAIAGFYATPMVSVLIGETIGRYFNDWMADWRIRKNHGVFEAEMRLWTLYLALPIYIVGFVTLGASFQKHLSTGAIIMGWGLAEVAIMITTVCVYAYLNNALPRHQGEVSALINLARVLGGFSVAYFQVPWATKHGALQTFGVEAAIVAGLFLLIVPFLQLRGRALREKFSL